MRTRKNKSETNHSKLYQDGYTLIPVVTDYIKPNESYDIIIENAVEFLQEGDFLVISETPISVSQGRLVDESEFQASILSFLLADVWSKYISYRVSQNTTSANIYGDIFWGQFSELKVEPSKI